jgi:hypothetical protein
MTRTFVDSDPIMLIHRQALDLGEQQPVREGLPSDSVVAGLFGPIPLRKALTDAPAVRPTA